MISLKKSSASPKELFFPIISTKKPPPSLRYRLIFNSHKNPKISTPNSNKSIKPKTHLLKPLLNPLQTPIPFTDLPHKSKNTDNSRFISADDQGVLVLCGFGYWVQGFRCFPWLALNFYMVNSLNLHPSTLQFVQHSAYLPMVAKPLYGVLSDALYIGDAHRIPYISIGVFLQVLSWGTLALIPVAYETLPTQMVCILVSNLGLSITEVATDALIAEFGKINKVGRLQSYAFMALAVGGILGNLFGGFFLLKTQQPKTMYLIITLLLSFQLAFSLTTRENSLGSSRCSNNHFVPKSLHKNLSRQFSNLITAINEESIFHPLSWVVASIAVVPVLSGTTFCYQTRFLNIDPSIIGISKVIGQLMLLSATVFYDRYLKRMPMRKLICGVQIMYAVSILLDLLLVTQINLKLGISNKAYVLCLSAVADAVTQFKILPFLVLFVNLCPVGCEGSLISFLGSALCLSSIFSGFCGIGLASIIGISPGDYSSLPMGILLQFCTALVPLGWISRIPVSYLVGKARLKRA